MAGLLRKDWYYIREYVPSYLPLLAMFCLIPGGTCGAYALMLALALPRAAIANDAQRWDRYAAMLPYTAEAAVGGKYVLCGLLAALGAVVTALSFPVAKAANRLLIRWGGGYRTAYPAGWDLLKIAVVMTLLAVIFIALALPFYYRFGVGKGQIGVNILMIYFILIGSSRLYGSFHRAAAVQITGTLVKLALLAAISALVSYWLSVGFYRARLRGRYDRSRQGRLLL